jgi:hypothetical protein
MCDLLLWTCVAGRAPLALALIRQAGAWSRDAVGAGMMARGPAAGERQASDSWLLQAHGRRGDADRAEVLPANPGPSRGPGGPAGTRSIEIVPLQDEGALFAMFPRTRGKQDDLIREGAAEGGPGSLDHCH